MVRTVYLYRDGYHRDIQLMTRSFPPRRYADLLEAGDAIGEQPAGTVVPVIDMHLMPRGAQMFGGGEASGAGPDDADRLAGRGADPRRLDPALGPGGIDRKSVV